jgi:HTH-type transcriptional regulator / antitoxin HigA
MDDTIRPIRTEQDYEAAVARVGALMGAQAGSAQGDTLDILATLVDAYEAEHHPIDDPDPIEAICWTMEARGLARRDLEPYIGSRARVSEILNRRRPLSLEMIRGLHAGLGIPASVLIRPYDIRA